ncbi:MAG: FAD-dependent monooxygenase [Coriobacteriia bacterium]
MNTIGTQNTEYSTVIAGTGPAGVMAAMHAAKRGRVLMADSSALPRDKSCGGMLNEYAQNFLGEFASVPDELVLGPRYVNFRYWDWDRGIKKPTTLRFLNVDRKSFDDWMMSLLPDNVEVVGSTSVAGFTQDADGVNVTLKKGALAEEIRCSNLIGADGARSTVRRSLGAGTAANYVTLQDFVELNGTIEPYFDCIYMRGIGDCFAYAYIVPKGDVAIVGSVYYPKTQRPHEKHEQQLAILRAAMPQLGETVKREACVALCVRDTGDVVRGTGRVLLTGEAGGFMSPTSGEGISYAMNSGRLAGLAVAGALNGNALTAYEASTDHIARNIKRKLRFLPFMESPTGKYLAGFVPTSIVSKVTEGL